LSAASDGAGGIAHSIVPELTAGAGDGGGDADAVGEVEAGIAGIAESVGEAREAVG